MTARSYLYVPGDRPDRIATADGRDADALILDLEDAVAPASKDDARATVASSITDLSTEVWVRVNAGERMAGDVSAVVGPGLHGVVIPKASADALAAVDDIVAAAEERAGLRQRSVRVAALVETAAGIVALTDIARAARVTHLALGEADLTADLGMGWSDENLRPIRTQVVVASAAAALDPPTAPVSTDFRDLDALRASTVMLRDMGFGARAAIHPDQVGVINDVFTPSADEVARARDLLARYDAGGGGVGVDADGRMIDEAVVRAARRVLALAGGPGV